MERDELLKRLMELDFIAVDLALFLNTHPQESEAIATYNQVITAADTVRMQIFLSQERSVSKCGSMKKSWNFR